jgi:outer membrane protein assembly factor BamB
MTRLVWCILIILVVVVTGVTLKLNFVQTESRPTKNVPSQFESLWTRNSGDDWPAFLGPNGDGKSKETGILQDWTQGKLKVLWTTDVGEGYGMGSVADGRYFHFDRHAGQARVRCLQAETGKPIWEFRYASNYRDMYGYDSGPRASPVVDGSRVYVFGAEGTVYCLAADSGEEIWKLDTSKKFNVIQNFFGVASSPVVCQDLLLLMVGGSPADAPAIPPGRLDRVKPNGSGIVAVDKFTGATRYQIADELASYSSIKLAKRDGQQVAFAWLRGSLVGFFPETGKSFLSFPWRSRKLESVNASMPVVVGDHVLISECYEIGSALLKWSTTGCDVVWTDQGKKRDFAMKAHWNTPIVVDGKLYGCSGRNSGDAELRCVDLLTGEVHWKERSFARSSLTYVDGHFVLMDEQGQLVLLKANPAKYQQVTAYDGNSNGVKFQSPCWAAPIISHGLMFVRGKNQLVCFELIPQAGIP